MSSFLRIGNPSRLSICYGRILKNPTPILNRYSSTNVPSDSKIPLKDAETLPKKKKNFNGIKFTAISLTSFGIGFAFMQYSSEIRKQIESTVPYSNNLFEYFDSFYSKAIDKIIAFKNGSKDKPREIETLKSNEKIKAVQMTPKEEITEKINETTKPIETPKNDAQKETKSKDIQKPKDTIVKSKVNKEDYDINKKKETQLKPVVAASTQTQTDLKKSSDDNVDTLKSDKIEVKSNWKEAVKEHELKEEAKIKVIEQKLHDGIIDATNKVSNAINESRKAIESLNRYRDSLKIALDENDDASKENQWHSVTTLFEIQTNDVKQANEKFLMAKKAISDLDELLVDVKTNNLNKFVKNLRDTQFELIKQHRQLQSEKSKLSEASINANVLHSYTNEQKLNRNQFLKEIQSLQPEGIKGKLSEELTNEELNSLLIHAHKRVIQLQNQINKMQTLENQHIEAALNEQKKQFESMQNENIEVALDSCKREFEIEKEKLAEQVKTNLYEDLKKELSRQAAAHNLHLAQMLKQQQDELDSLYEKRLLLDSEKIRLKYYETVADGYGRLRGVEQALLARANLEFQAQNAKKLWLAVQNLNEILSNKSKNLDNNQLSDIKTNIELIKQSAPDNQFVNSILEALNETLVNRGIWTEPDLKERFINVNDVCRKVALIDERGGSLFKYLISYLQSYFILSKNPGKLNHDLILDDEHLNNTFILLDYANKYLENGDFEMAIKLLHQLKGEPKRIASDWINEAIYLLEIKQACGLLTAYISSIYIGSNFSQ